MTIPRPAVSVIIPFAGSTASLDRLLGELRSLALRAGDELIVADNRHPGTPAIDASALAPGIRIVRADRLPGPGHARNCGARVALRDWLVFIDADTRPESDLLDAYFDPPPRSDSAILAGAIVDVARRPTLVARHDVARERMSQDMTLRRAGRPYAQTANCAVLRTAFESVGGFDERARGEDADLCFRLRDAGWGLEVRPRARVQHTARERVRPWLSQQLRHGRSAAWLNRRWPGEFPARGVRFVANRTVHVGGHVVSSMARGDRQEAGFALLDLSRIWAFELGRLIPDRPRRWPRPRGSRRLWGRQRAD